jgi:hypothetical protein
VPAAHVEKEQTSKIAFLVAAIALNRLIFSHRDGNLQVTPAFRPVSTRHKIDISRFNGLQSAQCPSIHTLVAGFI